MLTSVLRVLSKHPKLNNFYIKHRVIMIYTYYVYLCFQYKISFYEFLLRWLVRKNHKIIRNNDALLLSDKLQRAAYKISTDLAWKSLNRVREYEVSGVVSPHNKQFESH
jgi:hypothetical protein